MTTARPCGVQGRERRGQRIRRGAVPPQDRAAGVVTQRATLLAGDDHGVGRQRRRDELRHLGDPPLLVGQAEGVEVTGLRHDRAPRATASPPGRRTPRRRIGMRRKRRRNRGGREHGGDRQRRQQEPQIRPDVEHRVDRDTPRPPAPRTTRALASRACRHISTMPTGRDQQDRRRRPPATTSSGRHWRQRLRSRTARRPCRIPIGTAIRTIATAATSTPGRRAQPAERTPTRRRTFKPIANSGTAASGARFGRISTAIAQATPASTDQVRRSLIPDPRSRSLTQH